MNGLIESNSGLSIQAGATIVGGLNVYGGISVASGNVAVSAGPISITSTSTTAAALHVYASASGYTSDAITGRIASDAGAAFAMSATEGANLLFQVRCVSRS